MKPKNQMWFVALVCSIFLASCASEHSGVRPGETIMDGQAAYKRGDYATALRIYRPLAVQGNADAQLSMGVMYAEGLGVARDFSETAKWYRLGAEQGDARMQYYLGLMYGVGQGVTQDLVRAQMWIGLAAAAGHASAVKDRNIGAPRMTSQQIAEAQRMARDCKLRNFKGCD